MSCNDDEDEITRVEFEPKDLVMLIGAWALVTAIIDGDIEDFTKFAKWARKLNHGEVTELNKKLMKVMDVLSR